LQVLRTSHLLPHQGETFFRTTCGLPGLAFPLVPGVTKEIGLMASILQITQEKDYFEFFYVLISLQVMQLQSSIPFLECLQRHV
jgi:hypothetical protein